MGNTIISVEDLSKSYRLGQIGTGTLTNDLKVLWAKKHGLPNPLLKIGQTDHGNMEGETLWALKDVSFQVGQGEVLGIIGRNGAGKSTLLKILSRITAPSSGCVKIKGRIASLLEVGTGFHPDLTGRENIYLNGAILGMTKEEVRRKFDEIVAFAEIEKFVDTPVKRYSSGMYVRLAFSVAAHLESEILLVDEVLAVGDIEFQKKCLDKMDDVATKEGRTVLFVSHNMASVSKLCQRAILLNRGKIEFNDQVNIVIDHYLNLDKSEYHNRGIFDVSEYKERSGIGGGRIVNIELMNERREITSTFGIGEEIFVNILVHLDRDISSIVAGLEILSESGFPLINLRSDIQGIRYYTTNIYDVHVKVHILGLPLYPGNYILEPWFCETLGKRIDHLHHAIRIKLESRGKLDSEKIIQPGKGIILLGSDWD
jgi:lipopolysaccharide transport system ATP-binding protein